MTERRLDEDILKAAAKLIVSTTDGVQGISNLISTVTAKQKESNVKEPIVIHTFVANSSGDVDGRFSTRQFVDGSIIELLRQLEELLWGYEESEDWDIMNVTISWQEDDYVANVLLRHNFV